MKFLFLLPLTLAVIFAGPVQERTAEERLPLVQVEKSRITQGEQRLKDGPVVQEEPVVEQGPVVQEEPVMEEELRKLGERCQTCTHVVIDGIYYEFFRGPKRAADSEFFCQDKFPNGHLASVTSRYIHQQMMTLMAQNGGYTRTWIGGLRYLETGRFIWLDGSQWSYEDWLPGEPNDTAGVEDCVELLSDGMFNDMPCWDLRAFICSYRV